MSNSLLPSDRAVHNWFRFVLSFPPHLVREWLARFSAGPKSVLLDPFCGTGTTLVEAKLHGIPSLGIEATPVGHFASSVKVDWSPDPAGLTRYKEEVVAKTKQRLKEQGLENQLPPTRNHLPSLKELPQDAAKLLIKGAISPLPLHRTLVLLETLKDLYEVEYHRHALLSLARILPSKIGNLKFGPEVGISRAKFDVPVLDLWEESMQSVILDLHDVRQRSSRYPEVIVHKGDARQVNLLLEEDSVDYVITSPPYPNEKDYTRTTRLEAVLLGFLSNYSDLRLNKKMLVRSNTRGIYVEDTDDIWVANNAEVQEVASKIENRRIELGKTSGFERAYHRAVLLYFGGMARHFAMLKSTLRPGARLAYVVGEQASYLRIKIHTGHLLAQLAEEQGFQLKDIDLFRTRLSTTTGEHLREEVVLLQWPG